MITVVNSRNTGSGVYIGRPTVFGNPFTHIKDRNTLAEFICESRDEAVDKYEEWFYKELGRNKQLEQELKNLIERYKRSGELYLRCWCAPKRCHGDVIKKYIESFS